MASGKTILSENREYWTGRAGGYSKVNQTELRTAQREVWREELRAHIARQFPDREAASIQALEIGTGPGFFAILLAELGYDVTAIDLTPAMLAEAKKNAGTLAEKITFMEMNAEELSFPSGSFDVILSRNLTWNLPHPETAYQEWKRVLRPGGMLLNFDANWYENIGENFDQMERIAMRVPLSRAARPAWDHSVLSGLGMHVTTDTEAWSRVWSAEEKVNFASTPMFLVHAVAETGGGR